MNRLVKCWIKNKSIDNYFEYIYDIDSKNNKVDIYSPKNKHSWIGKLYLIKKRSLKGTSLNKFQWDRTEFESKAIVSQLHSGREKANLDSNYEGWGYFKTKKQVANNKNIRIGITHWSSMSNKKVF
jgi:hypothetical protein